MLNNEGWSLLFILLAVLLLLAAGFMQMGRDRSMERRLRYSGGAADTAMGIALRATGITMLAVLPGAIYLQGLLRIGMALSLGAGFALMLCVLMPRLRRSGGGALTVAQAVAPDRKSRVAFACVSILSLLMLAAGGISLLARIVASVFSLHYTIALFACTLLCTLLALLCSTSSRLAMDHIQIILTLFGLIAVPLLAMATKITAVWPALKAAFTVVGQSDMLGVRIVSDLLWGAGALGCVQVMHRAFGARNGAHARRGSRQGAWLICGMIALCALVGLLGRAVDDDLVVETAAETVLLQMAGQPTLPMAVQALLVTTLTTTVMMAVQGALSLMGNMAAWDIVLPLTNQRQERPLRIAADGAAVVAGALCFVLALNSGISLTTFACAGFMVSSVLAAYLVMKTWGGVVTPRGALRGLVMGTLVAAVWLIIPFTSRLGMLGVIPCVAATVLPMCFWIA